MCHMVVYEEWSCVGEGSQCVDHHVDVHGKCVECGVVNPGNLEKLLEIMGMWENLDEKQFLP